jgi:hypothetical protein
MGVGLGLLLLLLGLVLLVPLPLLPPLLGFDPPEWLLLLSGMDVNKKVWCPAPIEDSRQKRVRKQCGSVWI